MKKAFLLLCALLLALGSALPLAGYRLARAVLGRRADVPPAPASSTSAVSEAAPAAFEGDADVFLIEDLSIGEVQQVPKRDYLIGAAAAEMPLTWPDEALKLSKPLRDAYEGDERIRTLIDTAKALELGETEGAMSGLAIGLCGILTTVLALLADFFVI